MLKQEKTSKDRAKRKRIGKDQNENKSKSKWNEVDGSVWDIINRCKRSVPINVEDILNSPFKNERERIKKYSAGSHNISIVEAFEKIYGPSNISKEVRAKADIIPSELRVGSIIKLNIRSITKIAGVVFDSGSYKTNFITRNNLAAYDKLLDFIPSKPVTARVTEVRKDCTVVDIFGPMIEEYVVKYANDPWLQNSLTDIKPIRVSNLKLVRGGYTGKALIPNVSEFVGRDYEIDAFIPGSHIVLNATSNFEEYEGATVDAFIMNYTMKPGSTDLSLICSRKNLIKHRGNIVLKEIHSMWCDQDQQWDNFSHTPQQGIVTGVINSSKKCGVFVEIPSLNITGLISLPADQLTSYSAGMELDNVLIADLEEEKVYSEATGQYQTVPAFELEKGCIKNVNIRPILKLAE